MTTFGKRSPIVLLYDTQRLVDTLDEIGFTATSRGAFDSDIDDIRAIEAGRPDTESRDRRGTQAMIASA